MAWRQMVEEEASKKNLKTEQLYNNKTKKKLKK